MAVPFWCTGWIMAFDYVLHKDARSEAVLQSVTSAQAEAAQKFHSGIEGYAATPLVNLQQWAQKTGIGKIWVKDESKRFGLNAFKALGGSYAIARYLCGKLGIPVDENAFNILRSDEARQKLGQITFVTATDGNHGRGVAWAAKLLGHKAVVYLPEGSSLERLNNIRALGAEAEITKFNYDSAVRLAYAMSKKHGWVMVQDTAWPGYEEIPTWIMQGYTTMAQEIAAQLNGEVPTHLFLQAGVGSMAGAVLGYFAALWGGKTPVTVICEPDKAACLYKTAAAGDGQIHKVGGKMDSMMAGLCCGEPCTVSWDIIDNFASAFVACSDEYAARGMCLLGKPPAGDARVVSGESGAVTAGVLDAIMTEHELAPLREALGLNESSRVLLISTEGDTDKVNYLKVLTGKWRQK